MRCSTNHVVGRSTSLLVAPRGCARPAIVVAHQALDVAAITITSQQIRKVTTTSASRVCCAGPESAPAMRRRSGHSAPCNRAAATAAELAGTPAPPSWLAPSGRGIASSSWHRRCCCFRSDPQIAGSCGGRETDIPARRRPGCRAIGAPRS